MSVWREVQEALYARFVDRWKVGDDPRTPFALDNEDGFDPPAAPHAIFQVRARPGGPGTIGRPGNRKMDRVGVAFVDLREPPGNGVGSLSDLAEHARAIFENCRFGPHDIRFGNVDIGDESQVDEGRWWGVTVEARFDYEETV